MTDVREVCRSAVWENITGWEVVTTVLCVVVAWSIVQVSRMYFMAKVAQNHPPEDRS